jgi:hypothetical protein
VGPQRSSLRSTSARYSFPRSARLAEERAARLGEETPGPGLYDYASALKGVSVVMGTARSDRGSVATSGKHQQEQSHARDDEYEDDVPDTGRFRFNAPPRPTFGHEERGGKVMDSELLRSCPDHGYGTNSPGLVYSPDDSRVRPRSAPSFTMRKREAAANQQRSSTPSKVAPGSYAGAREDAIGVQRTSRRRSASASSFGRADRFSAPKSASGTLTDECYSAPSDFGDPRTGRRSSASHATFGKSTREAASRAGVRRSAGDRPVGAKISRPNLPHPPVAPRKEILRYGDNLSKPA